MIKKKSPREWYCKILLQALLCLIPFAGYGVSHLEFPNDSSRHANIETLVYIIGAKSDHYLSLKRKYFTLDYKTEYLIQLRSKMDGGVIKTMVLKGDSSSLTSFDDLSRFLCKHGNELPKRLITYRKYVPTPSEKEKFFDIRHFCNNEFVNTNNTFANSEYSTGSLLGEYGFHIVLYWQLKKKVSKVENESLRLLNEAKN